MYSVFRRISAAASALTVLLSAAPPDIYLVKAADTKYIALTFDDGPNTSTTNQVLDVLEEYNAKASFFLIGDNINEESAKAAKRAWEMGCEIDNHSKSHSYMSEMSSEEIKVEIESVNEQIYDITGTYPSFFRPPYISVSADMYDAIDVPFICGAGCDDWDEKVTAEQRAEKVLSQAQDGQIILLHDAQGNDQTVEALKTIIPELQKEGYTLVTLNELFQAQGVTPDEDSMYSVVPCAVSGEEKSEPEEDEQEENDIPDNDDIENGKLSYDSVNMSYQISVPKPSDQIFLDLKFSDEAKGGASGCIANGFTKDGVYYWAMLNWKAAKNGEVMLDIGKDTITLAYSEDGEDRTTDDEELIAEARKYLKGIKNFQAQVWWVGDASYNSIDTTNVKIRNVYLKNPDTASEPEKDPEEKDFITGDINGSGIIDVTDITELSLALLGDSELSAARQKAADVDGDGAVTLADLARLRQYLSKKTDSLR